MERVSLPSNADSEMNNVLHAIMDGAAGVPIILNSSPTTANQLLKEGQRGIFGNALYETINGITFQYGTAV